MRWRRERPGTVVCIRDAFYNVCSDRSTSRPALKCRQLPVRRLSHPNASRTIELVVKEIECFSLVFPHVAFSLDSITRSRGGETKKSRIISVSKVNASIGVRNSARAEGN